MSRVLLVEPFYPRSEPPIGLMKLSTWHKERGNEVRFIRGTDPFGSILGNYQPDQVDITTPIFSWRTDEGIQTVRWCLERFPDAHIRVGGVKATDTPEIYDIDRVELIRGILPEVDECRPDYQLFGVQHSIIYTQRGCPEECGFCRVWREEGQIAAPLMNWKDHIEPTFPSLTISDNNIVAAGSEHLKEVVSEIQRLGIESVDVNSGYEVHEFTEEHAIILSQLKGILKPVRTAFDELKEADEAIRTIKLIRKYIEPNDRKIICYCLFNFLETPEECLQRANMIVEAGASPYVMAFVPNNWIKGDLRQGEAWISERYGWTLDKAKKFKRFWEQWPIWRSVLKNKGKITAEDIW